MKVRIGVGLSAGSAEDADGFASTVLEMERRGFDSLWLSDVLTGQVLDPLTGLAFAAGVTRKLKLGTTLAVTGRNPFRLAKELATVDQLSRGRLLVVFVPGLADAREDQALGVPVADRGAVIEEVLPLLRRLWAGEEVDHSGRRFTYRGVRLHPRPAQQPLEVWLGGTARSALRRAGELSEGWLPSLCTPEEAARGRKVIEEVAAQRGRQVDPEHFGVSLAYARDAIPAQQVATIATRRPGVDPASLVPVGYPALRSRLEQFITAGFSKFVLRPAERPAAWPGELDSLAQAVLPLQT